MTLRTLLLAATALTGLASTAHAQALSFAPVPFAEGDAAKRAVTGSTAVKIGGMDVPVAWHIIMCTGDKVGGGVFGDLITKDGKTFGKISANPDFTSLLPRGDKIYAISHFEDGPGALYLTELAQDAAGLLTAVATKAIDLACVDGIWLPCAGSVTPWGC